MSLIKTTSNVFNIITNGCCQDMRLFDNLYENPNPSILFSMHNYIGNDIWQNQCYYADDSDEVIMRTRTELYLYAKQIQVITEEHRDKLII
jgi:hypothetical protein